MSTFARLVALASIQVAGLSLRLLQGVLFTRLLTQEDFGRYSALWSILAWTSVLVVGGWSSMFIARIPKDGLSPQIYLTATKSIATRFVVVGALQTLALLVLFKGQFATPQVLLTAAALLLLSLGSASAEAYRGFNRVLPSRALISVVPPLVPIIAVGVSVGLDVPFDTARAVLYVSVGWLVLWAVNSWRVYLLTERQSTWQHTRAREDFTLIKLSQAVVASVDVFIVSIVVGFKEAALYAVATRIAILGGFALNTVGMLYGPRLSAVANDPIHLRSMTYRATAISAAASLPIIGVLAVARETLLRLFGTEYVEAATVMLILLIGAGANAVFGPIGTVVNVNGQERTSRNVMVVTAVIFVPTVFWATQLWGISGAAWAWTAVTIAWNIALWVAADFEHGSRVAHE